MADCERLGVCLFFTGKMSAMPKAAALMKKNYCLGDKVECARYQVLSMGIEPPGDLFPNDLEQARQIVHTKLHARM